MADQQQNILSSTGTDTANTTKIGETYTLPNDEISLKELILKLRDWYRYLLSKWLIILIAGLIGGALGYIYASFKDAKYTATTTFVLEEGEGGGGLGQYAGIASMVGLDLGGGGGDIFKGENIIQLYKSKNMIRRALLSRDTFGTKQQLLIERYIEFKKMREGWVKQPVLYNLKFEELVSDDDRLRDSVIGKVIEEINTDILKVSKPDKKLSVIQVDVKSEDELFSKSFANNIVSTVNNFYVATKTKKSSENILILQQQADSVRRSLDNNIGGVAAAIDANPNINPAMQRLRANSQKKQVDVQANSAIYQEIVKNLELSKISLRKEKPLIQVIDEPVFPLSKSVFSKLKGLVIGGLMLGFFISLYLVLRKYLLDIMH